LKCEDGNYIGQCTAIVNYVARKAGADAGLEGTSDREFAMSQMLMAEGEDLWNVLGKFNPTVMASLEVKKVSQEDYEKLWAETVPGHLTKLEALVGEGKGFTASGLTAGELQLFAYLHQMKLCKPEMLAATPKVAAWFAFVSEDARVKNVLTGESSYGPMGQYMINPAAAE
jgi:glutathione S-transferase